MTKRVELGPVGGVDLPESGKEAVVAGAEAVIRTGLADVDARGEDWHGVHGDAGGDGAGGEGGVDEHRGWLSGPGDGRLSIGDGCVVCKSSDVGWNKDVAAGSLMRQNVA